MAHTLLVVDNLEDWAPYYPSEQLVTFEAYLATEQEQPEQRVRVINLCRSYQYLSDGYYWAPRKTNKSDSLFILRC